LNGLVHNSGVASRDVVENDRWGLAPSLAFGLGTPTRLTLSYYKLRQNNISDYGIPWVTATHNVLQIIATARPRFPAKPFTVFANATTKI
jgi:catecholate siderophore receptor